MAARHYIPITADVDGVSDRAKALIRRAAALARAFWPGALAIVLDAEGGGTEGVRVPDHAVARSLCRAAGGLWCKAAEDYLLAHAPKVEIGEPKELVKERIIRLG